jgi:hypothetical protein
LDSSAATAANVSSAADAAANRMKNLLIGGWGRLQEAMASPAIAPSETTPAPYQAGGHSEGGYSASPGSAQPTTDRHEAPTASAQSYNADPLQQSYKQRMPGSAAHTVHNPWAAATSVRAEMQREHVAMRSTLSGAGAHGLGAPHRSQGAGANQPSRHDQAPNGRDGVHESSGSESKTDVKTSAGITSDPLGVL